MQTGAGFLGVPPPRALMNSHLASPLGSIPFSSPALELPLPRVPVVTRAGRPGGAGVLGFSSHFGLAKGLLGAHIPGPASSTSGALGKAWIWFSVFSCRGPGWGWWVG